MSRRGDTGRRRRSALLICIRVRPALAVRRGALRMHFHLADAARLAHFFDCTRNLRLIHATQRQRPTQTRILFALVCRRGERNLSRNTRPFIRLITAPVKSWRRPSYAPRCTRNEITFCVAFALNERNDSLAIIPSSDPVVPSDKSAVSPKPNQTESKARCELCSTKLRPHNVIRDYFARRLKKRMWREVIMCPLFAFRFHVL